MMQIISRLFMGDFKSNDFLHTHAIPSLVFISYHQYTVFLMISSPSLPLQHTSLSSFQTLLAYSTISEMFHTYHFTSFQHCSFFPSFSAPFCYLSNLHFPIQILPLHLFILLSYFSLFSAHYSSYALFSSLSSPFHSFNTAETFFKI